MINKILKKIKKDDYITFFDHIIWQIHELRLNDKFFTELCKLIDKYNELSQSSSDSNEERKHLANSIKKTNGEDVNFA